MKTKEELTALKEEVEALNKKLAALSEEELAEVTGGFDFVVPNSDGNYEFRFYSGSTRPTDPAKYESELKR